MYYKSQHVRCADGTVASVWTTSKWWIGETAWYRLSPEEQSTWIAFLDEFHAGMVLLAAADSAAFDDISENLSTRRGAHMPTHTVMMAALRDRLARRPASGDLDRPQRSSAPTAWRRILDTE